MDGSSGVTLLYKPYMNFSVDEDLVSGLLTALNQFTIVEFKQGIESIEMGGLRWVYLSDKMSNLLFIAADTKDVTSSLIRARLDIIKQAFIEEYVKNEEYWKQKWFGSTEIFLPFKDVIAVYYTQWKQAEKVKGVAEFFDILGIFQNLLNLLKNVVEDHFSDKNKEIVYSSIEKLFVDYSNREDYKSHPELRNISFHRNTGINIVSINPMNCDMLVVERQIINIISKFVQLIREQVGLISSMSFFVQEKIYEYLLNNIALLKELNLDEFLLKLLIA
jgi:hypothetical protein